MKKKNRIFIKDWLIQKPYDSQTNSDIYYLKLCNKVYTIFQEPMYLKLLDLVNDEDLKQISCVIVGYFEDIISNIGLWKTFVNQHQKMYGKKLPFYQIEEYYDNEINEEDVCFLMWYLLNSMQNKTLVGPKSELILVVANKILEVLEEEYEYAPENNLLKSFYQLNDDETDYYTVRASIDQLLFNSYLFFSDTRIRLEEGVLETINDFNQNTLALMDAYRDNFIHDAYTSLLGIKGKDWLAELLGKNHPLYDNLKSMGPKLEGYFLYKGQDNKYVFLEHIASEKKFHLLKKSFDMASELTTIDNMVCIGLVQWSDEWWFSGVFIQTDFDANIVLNEKNSVQSHHQLSSLPENKKIIQEVISLQKRSFLKQNNNSQLVFISTSKINQFMEEFTNFHNTQVKLTTAEKKKIKENPKKRRFT